MHFGTDIPPGSTNVSTHVRIVDANGAPVTNAASAPGGGSIVYMRQNQEESVLAAPTYLTNNNDGHADNAMLHLALGVYRLDLPDAAFIDGADWIMVWTTDSVNGVCEPVIHWIRSPADNDITIEVTDIRA